MINKTEQEIMQKWPKNGDIPEVSIRCLAFNHEKYIANALDSFLMQETNFSFEIVVHDDASSDNTVNIIKEYETKYPNIIKPIYERENVYLKYDNSLNIIMANASRGKYQALCEGDDYWIDKNKLQKQYDIMKNNPNCILVVHNTLIKDLSNKKNDLYFNDCKVQKTLTPKDVFLGWNVHTSSFFFKSSLNSYFLNFPHANIYWFGDLVMLSLALFHGEVIYLPQTMSVYNKNNVNGLTYLSEHINNTELIKKEELMIQFYEDYNKVTSNAYLDLTSRVINYHKLICAYFKGDCKEILKKEEYRKSYKDLPLSMKLRIKLKAYFPRLFTSLKNKGN